MRESLAMMRDQAELTDVDCRRRTCTATLRFSTPAHALATIQQDLQRLAVQGCQGIIAIPTPPTGDGAYDMTVLYNGCRS